MWHSGVFEFTQMQWSWVIEATKDERYGGDGRAVVMIAMVFFATGESEDGQRLRFQVELEFVQCLANPNYLLCEYCSHS